HFRSYFKRSSDILDDELPINTGNFQIQSTCLVLGGPRQIVICVGHRWSEFRISICLDLKVIRNHKATQYSDSKSGHRFETKVLSLKFRAAIITNTSSAEIVSNDMLVHADPEITAHNIDISVPIVFDVEIDRCIEGRL